MLPQPPEDQCRFELFCIYCAGNTKISKTALVFERLRQHKIFNRKYNAATTAPRHALIWLTLISIARKILNSGSDESI